MIINGHGGNDFKQMLRELQPQFPTMFLCTINWWKVVPEERFFGQVTDHAARMETSCMLYIASELVMLKDAGSGKIHDFSIEGLRKRWAWAQREWSKASDDTGMGPPLPADVKKGGEYLRCVTTEIGKFLFDLAKTPLNRLYR